MGKMIVVIPDELEKRFQREVGRRFGAKRGNIKSAFIEAIELWINKG